MTPSMIDSFSSDSHRHTCVSRQSYLQRPSHRFDHACHRRNMSCSLLLPWLVSSLGSLSSCFSLRGTTRCFTINCERNSGTRPVCLKLLMQYSHRRSYLPYRETNAARNKSSKMSGLPAIVTPACRSQLRAWLILCGVIMWLLGVTFLMVEN